MSMSRTFYEFFAGGGMARAGLGVGWKCLLANDLDRKKAETYKLNWGSDGLIVDDIQNILPQAMPGKPDLVWGSFPCQDLSLAGRARMDHSAVTISAIRSAGVNPSSRITTSPLMSKR